MNVVLFSVDVAGATLEGEANQGHTLYRCHALMRFVISNTGMGGLSFTLTPSDYLIEEEGDPLCGT